MHTLTVQDVLWINLTITKRVNGYRFADLEEATYYQYAYGQASSLTSQAERFFRGFILKRPIDAGVEATAFVALVTYLRLNDADLSIDDADGLAWYRRAVDHPGTLESAIVASEAHDHGHNPPVRAIVLQVIRDYPITLRGLQNLVAA